MNVAFGAFGVIFAIAAAVVLSGFVFVIVMMVRNAKKVRDAGHDPFTLNAELTNRVLASEVLAPAAPPQTLEQRLAEVDGLQARGVISAEEHAQARAEILKG
ncbi:SHOCT domain-containing protein [Microbacterium terricola]|nr:SHOCT domain-containing protein [Microbacterium terricola]UYK41212.1 SHOCT domain-containing protein [Microbacterium terricola]